MYLYENPTSSFGHFALGQPSTPDQIRYIEARVTPVERDGRLQTTFEETGAMEQKKRESFIKKFVNPILKYEVGRKLFASVNKGNHPVAIAWSDKGFGFNGTIAINRPGAVGGRGSAAVIFIDMAAQDLKNLPTIVANPDVGLFHELLHAWHMQNGTVVNDEEEMERRVIGIGKYIKAKGTENDYRETRNLDRRCCWRKEKL